MTARSCTVAFFGWGALSGCVAGEGDCDDTTLVELPVGAFTPAYAPTEALKGATVTVQEGSLSVVYIDETGATWTAVYGIAD